MALPKTRETDVKTSYGLKTFHVSHCFIYGNCSTRAWPTRLCPEWPWFLSPLPAALCTPAPYWLFPPPPPSPHPPPFPLLLLLFKESVPLSGMFFPPSPLMPSKLLFILHISAQDHLLKEQSRCPTDYMPWVPALCSQAVLPYTFFIHPLE